MLSLPLFRLTTKAILPFTRSHVLKVLSLPTDSASFPDGWTLKQLTAPLKKSLAFNLEQTNTKLLQQHLF